MKWLRIDTKLLIGLGLLLGLVIAVWSFSMWQIHDIAGLTDQLYKHPYTVSNSVRDIRANIIAMHRSMKDVALAENKAQMTSAIKNVDAYEKETLELFDLVLDRYLGNKDQVRKFKQEFIDWKNIRSEVISHMMKDERAQAANITKDKGAKYVDTLNSHIDELVDFASNKGVEFHRGTVEYHYQSDAAMLIFLLLATIIFGVTAFFMTRSAAERSITLEELARKNKLNQLLLDSLPHPAVLIHKNRSVIAANRPAKNIGIEVGAKCSRDGNCQSCVLGEEDITLESEQNVPAKTACKHVTQALDEHKTVNIPNIKARGKIWDTFWIPLSDEACLHYAYDITEMKKLEDRLHQTEKMEAIAQLAGGIAHDFNNQLAGIMGYAEIIESKVDDTKLKHHTRMILSAAIRSADLTNQLLAFARKGDFTDIPVNLHNCLKMALDLIEPYNEGQISISKKLAADTPITIGDTNQLQGVFYNIMLNAFEAMSEGGQLTITTSEVELADGFAGTAGLSVKKGSYLKIEIEDTGIGMDSSTIRRMFEPFFTTKKIGDGTGMGLAAAYGSIERHKGTIEVTCAPGKGTSLCVYLPQKTQPKKPENLRPTMASPNINLQHATRILVVDDEEIVRELATDLLGNLGFEVFTAEDGRDGVEKYQELYNDIDIVILDMSMPRMNGREAFREMKKINPDIKAIICSGYDLTDENKSIMDEGVLDFIHKPFNQARMAQAINQALSQPRKS